MRERSWKTMQARNVRNCRNHSAFCNESETRAARWTREKAVGYAPPVRVVAVRTHTTRPRWSGGNDQVRHSTETPSSIKATTGLHSSSDRAGYRRRIHFTAACNRLTTIMAAMGAATAISTKNPAGMVELPAWRLTMPASADANTANKVMMRSSVLSPNWNGRRGGRGLGGSAFGVVWFI